MNHPAAAPATMSPATMSAAAPSSIDMLNPAQTCAALRIDEHRLLSLVNQARLAAYNLGEGIRFRSGDVALLASGQDRALLAA